MVNNLSSIIGGTEGVDMGRTLVESIQLKTQSQTDGSAE